MDKTVIILIGAGVCCVVIGFALFVKLLTTKSNDDDETTGNRKLLDDEYAENFKECFENTGNIEEALEQLAQIYLDNQFMYNLIVSALDYMLHMKRQSIAYTKSSLSQQLLKTTMLLH